MVGWHADSGAGRFSRLHMGTMTLLELGASSGAVSLGGLLGGRAYAAQGSFSLPKIAELVVRGGWPGTIGSSTKAAAAMALEYIDTIAEQDVSEVDQVRRALGVDAEPVLAVLAEEAGAEADGHGQRGGR